MQIILGNAGNKEITISVTIFDHISDYTKMAVFVTVMADFINYTLVIMIKVEMEAIEAKFQSHD